MDDRIVALIAVLLKFDVTGMGEPRLHQIARELNFRVPHALMMNSNRSRRATKKNGVKEELLAIAKSSAALMDRIHNLHGDSLAAVSRGDKHDPLWIWSDLQILNDRCWNHIENQPDTEASEGGSPKKNGVNVVSDILANHYYTLTGCKPTVIYKGSQSKRYGPFIDFVTDIFSIFGIQASAKNQARGACDRWAGDDRIIDSGLSTVEQKITKPPDADRG